MRVETNFDYSLSQVANQIPNLIKTMRNANAIVCIKELYRIGEMTKDEYSESLCNLLKNDGFIKRDV